MYNYCNYVEFVEFKIIATKLRLSVLEVVRIIIMYVGIQTVIKQFDDVY